VPPTWRRKRSRQLSPAEEAAQKIKADEAQAKARRAAIKYLGTVDCHYFPEAEKALIGGLLNDRNECVRLEAALALGHGCCCTKKTIEALQVTVSGSNKLGNPGETSERVKAAAFAALQRCLARQGRSNRGSRSAPRKRSARRKHRRCSRPAW